MITCFGEVLIDCLPSGDVIGGAPFNVAINLKKLGNEVDFISQIGNDKYGKLILDLAQKQSIANNIQQSDEKATGTVSVTFEDGEPQYTINTDRAWHAIDHINLSYKPSHFVFGSLATFTPFVKETFSKYYQENSESVFVCDLNIRKPFISNEHILFCLNHCSILKINEDEWTTLEQLFSLTEQALVEYIFNQFGINHIILTLGSKGAKIITPKETVYKHPPLINEENFKDPIGAGDGFLASYLHHYTNSGNMENSLNEALKYASLICQNKGAILP
ncbi:PfkB family carbohydrate kinase [Cyclobacteriaceae bacterium]|nr:PfkB family carbohydrate kinase [Cyclobacteriaceae bacterium]